MTNDEDILFGGFAIVPPKTEEFKKPDGRPVWFQVIEKAFEQLTSTDEGKRLYGDPNKGATLEQAWRTSGIFTGSWPVCLLSLDKPKVSTDAISHLVTANSQQLVDALANILGLSDRAAAVVLFYDGYRGHCITLFSYDSARSRFIYHDPWPNVSLLSKDQNAAGVDAQREGRRWSVTAEELEKVIFAAFVDQSLWAEYTGEKYYTTYDELKNSDFWSFFHIKEAAIREQPDNTTAISLQTGGFQDKIDLLVTLNKKKRLTQGQLGLDRSWVLNQADGLNPFALDIARSFITTFIPPPDQPRIAQLIQALHEIQTPERAKQLLKDGPEKSMEQAALFTYLGASPEFKQPFDFSNLSMTNSKTDQHELLQINIESYAL